MRYFLKKLKSSSSGPDQLSPQLLKAAHLEIDEVLARLFNSCISNSYVPTQFKFANITPIPKVSNPTKALDYRPIANLAALDKVFQRVIVQYILKITLAFWNDNIQFTFYTSLNANKK